MGDAQVRERAVRLDAVKMGAGRACLTMNVITLDDGVVAPDVDPIDTSMDVVGDERTLSRDSDPAATLVVDLAVLNNRPGDPLG
jgi:hypothetical protein